MSCDYVSLARDSWVLALFTEGLCVSTNDSQRCMFFSYFVRSHSRTSLANDDVDVNLHTLKKAHHHISCSLLSAEGDTYMRLWQISLQKIWDLALGYDWYGRRHDPHGRGVRRHVPVSMWALILARHSGADYISNVPVRCLSLVLVTWKCQMCYLGNALR